MGKIIKVIFENPERDQSISNIEQLKKLVEKYIHKNKKFVINKIKDEQFY